MVVKVVGAVVVVDGGESLLVVLFSVLCDVSFRSVSFWSHMPAYESQIFLQSCMILSLFQCPLFHMSLAKLVLHWPKSSLQNCAMLVSMVYGGSRVCLFYLKLFLNTLPVVGRRNVMS